MAGVAVDGAKQFADARRIGDARMVLFRGRGQRAVEIRRNVALAAPGCHAVAKYHADPLPRPIGRLVVPATLNASQRCKTRGARSCRASCYRCNGRLISSIHFARGTRPRIGSPGAFRPPPGPRPERYWSVGELLRPALWNGVNLVVATPYGRLVALGSRLASREISRNDQRQTWAQEDRSVVRASGSATACCGRRNEDGQPTADGPLVGLLRGF